MLVQLAVLAATAAHGAEKKGGLPQLNTHDFSPQLIWLALAFAALYFLMSRIALPRIGEVLEERADRIQRDLDEAARLKGETEKALANYEKALADARANASALARETQSRVGAEVDKERARVDTEIGAKLADAESRIAATKSQALTSVNDIAADTASAIVGRLLGEEARPDEVAAALKSVGER
jgi:F-type H+-transporting ATPase subunit b